MRDKDNAMKRKANAKPVFKNFVVPELSAYKELVKGMDAAYSGGCPVCHHQGLTFLSESGIWQASKDKMKPGYPYGHADQIVRWCCTCCNK